MTRLNSRDETDDDGSVGSLIRWGVGKSRIMLALILISPINHVLPFGAIVFHPILPARSAVLFAPSPGLPSLRETGTINGRSSRYHCSDNHTPLSLSVARLQSGNYFYALTKRTCRTKRIQSDTQTKAAWIIALLVNSVVQGHSLGPLHSKKVI